jgi:type II secretion system protein N
MARSESILLRPIPRALLILGVPIAGFWITLSFIILGFPYNVLADNLGARLEQSLKIALDIGDVAVKVSPAGPGFSFQDVSARFPDGQTYDLDRLYIRPAWSFSWLRGSPSLVVDVATPLGSADGTLEIGEPKRWDGELRGVDLAKLPLTSQGAAGIEISGIVDATVNLVYGEGEIAGNVDFQAEDGVLAHDAMPMGMPYKTFTGQLHLGTEASLAEFEAFRIDSPMMGAALSGTIGRADQAKDAPLDVTLKLSDADPTLLEIFKNTGAKITGPGAAELHVGGTWGAPALK